MSIKKILRVLGLVSSLWVAAMYAETTPTPAPSDNSTPPAATAPPADNAKKAESPSSAVNEDANDKATPLNHALKSNRPDDMIPSVYKDMVVVQRKAKQKAGNILFAPSVNLDFSDGPITNYAINLDVGYALSDFWEVYANIVPTFVTIERPIVNKVRQLGTLANGQQASITYARPINQFGADLLWLPAYGKESWGPYSIVRSDTFFKLQVAEVNFAGGSSGMRYALMVGKTYYISRWFNLRADAGISYMESIVDDQKTGDWAPVIDLGAVYYF